MKRGWFAALVVTVAIANAVPAWSEGKITVTREESKPATLEVTIGEPIVWVNATGGTAHVDFGQGVRFYLGKDPKLAFEKPGTYDYTVHVSGTKTHAHRGRIVVK